MTVMKMPSEKMPNRMAFFRRGSLARRSIGNGVHILEGRRRQNEYWRRGRERIATYIITSNTIVRDAILV